MLGVLLGLFGPWGPRAPVLAAEPATIRVGVLKFGTVSWELQVIQDRGLAKQEGVDLKVIPLAGKDATSVALQGGAADIIVNDWVWVSRQRAAGHPLTFVPYSLAVGSVIVRPDTGINTLADLRGKRLGVAGGPVDKSWLLLRAYAKKTLHQDLARLVEPNFAAPPLLNELMLRGELPAVLNFWHYGARLKAAGMRELITIREILPALGVEGDLPLIGWVFDETWANRNRAAVEGFLRASRKAEALMATSDEVWERLRPIMEVKDEATFRALRDGYRAGIPRSYDEQQIAATAKRVFEILAEVGGEALIGKSRSLAPGTFWK
jgi:NitT/TauT family transport system substrate-binding protein